MNDISRIHPLVCSRYAAKERICSTVTRGDEELCFPIFIPEMNSIRNAKTRALFGVMCSKTGLEAGGKVKP
jgi:hypothetical protein